MRGPRARMLRGEPGERAGAPQAGSPERPSRAPLSHSCPRGRQGRVAATREQGCGHEPMGAVGWEGGLRPVGPDVSFPLDPQERRLWLARGRGCAEDRRGPRARRSVLRRRVACPFGFHPCTFTAFRRPETICFWKTAELCREGPGGAPPSPRCPRGRAAVTVRVSPAGLLRHGHGRRRLDGHPAAWRWQCRFPEDLERI